MTEAASPWLCTACEKVPPGPSSRVVCEPCYERGRLRGRRFGAVAKPELAARTAAKVAPTAPPPPPAPVVHRDVKPENVQPTCRRCKAPFEQRKTGGRRREYSAGRPAPVTPGPPPANARTTKPRPNTTDLLALARDAVAWGRAVLEAHGETA